MAIRGLCGCLIVFCGALMGLECRRKLRTRLSSLERIRDYLGLVTSYISHWGMSLDEVVDEIVRTGKTDDFSLKLNEYCSHYPFYAAFSRTVNELQSSLCLTDEDREILISLVRKIGGFDMENAVSCLAVADSRLSEMIVSARRKCETEGKIYFTMCFSLSVVLALIIL